MKRRNTITACLFLLLMAGGFVLLLTSFLGREGSFEALLKTFAKDKDVTAFLAQAETAVNQDLDRDHLFIQLYGGIQRLTGRRMVEDAVDENTVVKLSTGALNFVKPDSRRRAWRPTPPPPPNLPGTWTTWTSPTSSSWPPRRSSGGRTCCPWAWRRTAIPPPTPF